MPTKTKTSLSGLTPEEQKELERRGFLVKNLYKWGELFSKIAFAIVIIPYIPLILIGLLVVGFIYSLFDARPRGFSSTVLDIDAAGKFIGLLILSVWIFGVVKIGQYISAIFGGFLMAGRLFYSTKGCIFGGKLFPDLTLQNIKTRLAKNNFLPLNSNTPGVVIPTDTNLYILALLLPSFYILPFELSFIQHGILLAITYGLASIVLSIILLGIITALLYRKFNPLYAFGNLGSKIQSLTPRITEESEKIEKEFSTDMNFRTLSDSFDTLAQDFSKISSYVIKLEYIEKKANKGNLFDSEKYIGSLREDIVKPLTALRVFLQKKKTELEASQQEMKKVRVRVGGSGNGEGENLELQSKRSEPLIAELTENIEKLGGMIEKFGML